MNLFRILLLLFCLPVYGCMQEEESPREPSMPELFSAEVEMIIHKKIKLIQEQLHSPEMIEWLRNESAKHEEISNDDIALLDKQWQEQETLQGLAKEVNEHECSNFLRRAQQRHKEFSEMFVTSMRGLNVCQTNKTSDYNQADEAWWVETSWGQQGKAHHGSIEYDESAGKRSVALYIPIYDMAEQQLIGISKNLLTIEAIKEEL